MGCPAHNVGVKLACGFGIAGHDFVPAELSFWRKHRQSSPCWRTHRGIRVLCTGSVDINLIKGMSIRLNVNFSAECGRAESRSIDSANRRGACGLDEPFSSPLTPISHHSHNVAPWKWGGCRCVRHRAVDGSCSSATAWLDCSFHVRRRYWPRGEWHRYLVRDWDLTKTSLGWITRD